MRNITQCVYCMVISVKIVVVAFGRWQIIDKMNQISMAAFHSTIVKRVLAA